MAIVYVIAPDDHSLSLAGLARDGLAAVSDGRGEFELTAPAAGRVLVARHPDYVPASLTLSREKLESQAPVILRLAHGLSIRGHVLCGSSNVPVAGIRVVARGAAASASSGRADTLPAFDAQCQASVTGEDGSFEIRGLRDGPHQVEVVAPGLGVIRHYFEDEGLVTRLCVVRAGTVGVELRVMPLSVGIARLIDAESGYLIAHGAAVRPLELPDGLRRVLPVKRGTINGYSSADFGGLPVGAFIFQFAGTQWPLPERARMLCEVDAPGYRSKRVYIPLRPMGLRNGWGEAAAIRMDRESAHGSCRLRLVDRDAAPVGPVTLSLVLDAERQGDADLAIRARFGEDGWTPPMSAPVGAYVVRSFPEERYGKIAVDRPVQITDAGLASVELVLGWGVLRVEVFDDKGRPVDDAGLRFGRGHEPVRIRRFAISPGRNIELGRFSPPPGMGSAPASLFLLFDAEGPYTVEAHRHGYAPGRSFVTLRPGSVETARITLRRDTSAVWEFR